MKHTSLEPWAICLLLPLLGMCKRMSCWKAAVGVQVYMCSLPVFLHTHTCILTLTHTLSEWIWLSGITVTLFSMSTHDWGDLSLEPFIDRAPTSNVQTTPRPPPPPLPSAKHDKHLLLLWSCVGPDASACLPIWLSRPCLGSYLQVKTCRLHSVSLYVKERKWEKCACRERKDAQRPKASPRTQILQTDPRCCDWSTRSPRGLRNVCFFWHVRNISAIYRLEMFCIPENVVLFRDTSGW